MAGSQWLPQLAPNAAQFAAQQAAYLERQTRLWSALLSGTPETVAKPDAGDRRFAGREWRENRYYDYLRQSYLLAARFLSDLVEGAELEAAAKERLRFAARQWIDAMSPANFAATNPQVIRKAVESGG